MPASSPKKYSAGTAVLLDGLKARADLNGKQGVLTKFVVSSGRYAVKLADGGEELAVKESNFSVVKQPARDPQWRSCEPAKPGLREHMATAAMAQLRREGKMSKEQLDDLEKRTKAFREQFAEKAPNFTSMMSNKTAPPPPEFETDGKEAAERTIPTHDEMLATLMRKHAVGCYVNFDLCFNSAPK